MINGVEIGRQRVNGDNFGAPTPQTFTLNFTPAAGVSGPVVISYTLTDDKGASSTGTLTVNVGANNPPVANADSAAVVESGVNPGNTAFAGPPTASGNVLATDSDPAAGDSTFDSV